MSSAALLLLAILAQTSTGGADLSRLRSALAEHPEDVDVRLKLALALSRNGATDEARQHAEAVVRAAPKYWDAQLLLARLDAWAQRYDQAEARLHAIIAQAPELRDARSALAEVELWSGELDQSKEDIERLLVDEHSPELLGRLAQVEYERQHHLSAYLIAKEALALDPAEQRALGVKEAVLLVRADLRFEAENLPGPKDGHGEIITVTALPGNLYGFSITEEFRQRYGTTNNRVAFEGLWLPAKGWTVAALFAFGLPAKVIADVSASARVTAPIFELLDGGLSYTFDHFPDSVVLHRARVDLGFRIHHTLQAVIAYVFGVLSSPTAGTDSLHYGSLALDFESLPYALSLSYGFGRQIDRVVLDPTAPLFSYLSHEIRVFAAYEPVRWIRVGVDLGTVIRSNKTRVDTLGILARFSF